MNHVMARIELSPNQLGMRTMEMWAATNATPQTHVQKLAQTQPSQRIQESQDVNPAFTVEIGALDEATGGYEKITGAERIKAGAVGARQAVAEAFGNPAIHGVYAEIYQALVESPKEPSSYLPQGPTTQSETQGASAIVTGVASGGIQRVAVEQQLSR